MKKDYQVNAYLDGALMYSKNLSATVKKPSVSHSTDTFNPSRDAIGCLLTAIANSKHFNLISLSLINTLLLVTSISLVIILLFRK